MPKQILPTKLYKLIPAIYIGSGIYFYAKLDTVFALISGSMLVGAGIFTIWLRHRSVKESAN